MTRCKKPKLSFAQTIKQRLGFQFTSLRSRITAIVIGLAIGPVMIVGIVIGLRSFASLESQSLTLHRQVAESVGSKIKALMDQRVNELQLLNDLHSLGRQPPETQRAILSTLLFQQHAYQELTVLDDQGWESIRLSRSDVQVDQPGERRFEQPEFRFPFSRREVYFSPVRFDDSIREPLLTIALPLMDLERDRVISVLVADVRFKIIWELLANLASSFHQSEVYVTDEEGQVVAHRNPTIVLQGTRLDLPEGDGRGVGLTQQPAIIARDALKLGIQNLIVIAEQPVGQALSLAIANRRTVMAAIAAALVLASGLAIFAIRRTVRPIEDLGAAARTLSGGDYSVRVDLASRDEIGQLARAFNQMVDNLKQVHDTLEQQVQERTAALEQKNVQLNREIAERQQLESQIVQAQKMQAIGTLAGGIAHEFNNNLAVILGFTELATHKLPPTAPMYDDLQAVLTAVYRAKELVQQILTFSHQHQPKREAVPLGQLVQESLNLVRASLPVTVAIESHIAPDAGMVLAESTQLHQILMNLCANAEHAMRQNGGTLTIEVVGIEVEDATTPSPDQLPSGAYVKLTVRDTGSGITPESISRIFEPFYTTKSVGEGTGMGLAIVHGIVTSYGGEIRVTSQPGEGSAFAIYLPKLQDVEEAPASHPANALPRGRGCILWIDDEPLLLRMGEEMLTSLGYEVVARLSSVEALDTFRATPHHFDLVITDQTMPNLTGEKLAQAMRRIRADIPIILCTGFSHVIDEEQAARMGLNGAQNLVGGGLA